MATLSQAKVLGGVGAILVFIPFVSVVGFIMIMVAVKQISDDLQDMRIFNDMLIAVITGIVGALVSAFIVISVVATIFGTSYTNPISSNPTTTDVVGVVVGAIFALGIAWAALIVSAVFIRRSYATIADRLGVGTFRTAGTLYLVGAATTIVLVGFLLLFIAEILQAVAYFSIPDTPPTQAAAQAAAVAPPQGGATKFCVNCGAELAGTATFCNNCGAKQP